MRWRTCCRNWSGRWWCSSPPTTNPPSRVRGRRAIDYNLKPIDDVRFTAALVRVASTCGRHPGSTGGRRTTGIATGQVPRRHGHRIHQSGNPLRPDAHLASAPPSRSQHRRERPPHPSPRSPNLSSPWKIPRKLTGCGRVSAPTPTPAAKADTTPAPAPTLPRQPPWCHSRAPPLSAAATKPAAAARQANRKTDEPQLLDCAACADDEGRGRERAGKHPGSRSPEPCELGERA